jgi:hypothetical protein
LIGVLAWLAGATGCGSGGGGNATTGTGGAPGALDGACALDARVGGFNVELHPAASGNPAFASISGGVRNGVLPAEAWHQEGEAAGGCRLMVGPGNSCPSACVSPQVCGLENQCIDQPTLQSAGQVTITGVGPSVLALSPVSPTSPMYSGSVTSSYPPFAADAAVHLAAAGAAVPAFSLDGRGIEPLAFDGTSLTVTDGQALALSWTPPAQAGAAGIFALLEIGHHGGVFARVECDLADTGSGEVPASLISALVAKGVAGFPTVSLSRRTVDSTTTAPGCVDFTVASPVEQAIVVCSTAGDCAASCSCGGALAPCTGDASEIPCPSGKTCKADFTCS